MLKKLIKYNFLILFNILICQINTSITTQQKIIIPNNLDSFSISAIVFTQIAHSLQTLLSNMFTGSKYFFNNSHEFKTPISHLYFITLQIFLILIFGISTILNVSCSIAEASFVQPQ